MTEHFMETDDGGGRTNRMPVDYPSNARRLRAAKEPENPQPEKKVEKVIEGNVVGVRKRSMWRKAGDVMSGEETGEGVLYYILTEVFVPATKSLISEVISQGVDRYLFGVARPKSRHDRPSGYTNYSARARPTQFGHVSQRARMAHDFDEVILAERGEAEDVLDGLRDLIEQYEWATVADFYDLVGHNGSFTDDKWGWTDLRGASVRATSGGYMIRLPRTHALD